MIDYYGSNLTFFKENSRLIYDIITDEAPQYPETNVTSLESEELNFILSDKENRCVLNSLVNMKEQMARMMSGISQDVKVLIVLGFECGYFIEEVLKNRPAIEHIVVIEPCLKLFQAVIHKRDITPVFMKNKSISIVLNQDMDSSAEFVSRLLFGERHKKKAFIGHITYRTLFPSMYERLIKGLKEYFLSETVELVTTYQTLHLFSYNIIKSQKYEHILAEGLFEEMRALDCPAIVVSAGPSLARDMQLLHELKKKAFVVAVGTAIRILDVHGIKPHLRVAIDASPSEGNVFDGVDTCTVPLLFSEKIHEDILANYSGIKYSMILDVDWLSKFFYNNTGYNQTLVRSGYSVANLTVDLMARLGFKRVIMMGQDLCYRDSRMYAEGAYSNEKVDYSERKFLKIKNDNGEDIYTTLQFLSMKYLFERIILQHPDTEFINSTVDGLPINGTIRMSITEAMKNARTEPLLEGIHERVKQRQDGQEQMLPVIRDNYRKMIREVENVVKMNEQHVEYLKSVAEYETIEEASANVKMFEDFKSALNKFHVELDEIDLYRNVFRPCLQNIVSSLQESHAYCGDQPYLKIQSLYKSELSQITEIQRYAYLLRELGKELPIS